MSGAIQYAYSKKNSIVTIIVMVILGLLFVSNILKAYHNSDRIDMILFAVFTCVLIFLLGIVISKRLRPSLNNDIALEFNESCIIDYLRNITINWGDIKKIDFRRTRSSSLIILQLKWESDYGADITISLRWIEGKDQEIYNMAVAYFDQFADKENLSSD